MSRFRGVCAYRNYSFFFIKILKAEVYSDQQIETLVAY